MKKLVCLLLVVVLAFSFSACGIEEEPTSNTETLNNTETSDKTEMSSNTETSGKVYYEPKYPNIYFAIDGEIYTFEGRKYIVVGGAHSVDRLRCLEKGYPFWEDEIPDDSIKLRVEEELNNENNEIFGVMTHTCPLKYLPTEMFMSTQRKVAIKRKPNKKKSKKFYELDINRSTEEWLDKLEEKLKYTVWYCGHYHVDKEIDKMIMMCNKIRPLHY